jgi:hypothetical protein
MQRIDLYGPVHKGLRAALCETATLLGRTDFESREESRAAQAAVGRILAFLDEHAEHEDRVILPEIGRRRPELQAELRSDHARIEGLQSEAAALAARLGAESAAERVSLGARLHERVWILVAEHARHMQAEESRANRVLHANLDDAELLILQERIVADIPPERMAEWMEIMLPALAPSERKALEHAAGGGR